MTNSLVETLIGALVVAVAGVFLVYAYTTTGMTAGSGGYQLFAIFSRADGITTGTDVRVAGIKVGTVTGMSLDHERYLARVEMHVDNEVKLPDDSSVKVASEGLLGGSYLSVEPGGNDTYLEPGGEIEFTQGNVDLLSIISQAMFSLGGKDEEEGGGAPADAGTP